MWSISLKFWFAFPFSLSCIGEGNGNPLQCSCLENPRDRGAWWAAVYGVAQNRIRLKWLSSSSSSNVYMSVLLSQFVPPSPSPTVFSTSVLYFCISTHPANKFISTNFLDSIYMHIYISIYQHLLFSFWFTSLFDRLYVHPQSVDICCL